MAESDNSGPCVKPKLSHKQWKALLRREKRRNIRQQQARDRETEKSELEEADSSEELSEELAREEAERERQNQLWLEREKLAQLQFEAKKKLEEQEKLRRLEQERKIKEEWEERQKLEEKERQLQEEKKSRQYWKCAAVYLAVVSEELLREATANEHKDDDGPWHNPILPPGKERDRCPFFSKTATCRFGDRCSRGHVRPETSTVLLFPGMYSHFELEQGLNDEYDTDLILEYEDSELIQNFKEFYDDIVPEFKTVGRVIQLRVCCNYEPHLRGNVYVEYKREEDAIKAFQKFNGRFYGGKQMSCEFVTIPSWKSAICGLYGSGKCPKGRNCNFLHVFKNPRNEFMLNNVRDSYHVSRSSRDYYSERGRENGRDDVHRDYYRSRSHRSHRSRSRSRSRSRRRRRSNSRNSNSPSDLNEREGSYSSRHRHKKSKSRDRKKEKRKRSRSRSQSRRKEKDAHEEENGNKSKPESELNEESLDNFDDNKNDVISLSQSPASSSKKKKKKKKKSEKHPVSD